MTDIVSLKHTFYSLYCMYQHYGGKKSIHDYDNKNWKPFGPNVYLCYKIKQVILDFPIQHPLDIKLHQLKKDQSQLVHTIDKETDPDTIHVLEKRYDEWSDQVYDMEQEVYKQKSKHTRKIKKEHQLRFKIHDMTKKEDEYQREHVLYDILDECRKMSSLLKLNLSR